jgi:hypothetical protein
MLHINIDKLLLKPELHDNRTLLVSVEVRLLTFLQRFLSTVTAVIISFATVCK